MNKLPVVVLIVLVLTFLTACRGGDQAPSVSESRSGTPTASSSAAGSIDEDSTPGASPAGNATMANDLAPGDCFNTDGSQVDEVSVVDCEQPHFYEAFLNYDMTQGDDEAYPGDEAVLNNADGECRPAFEEYVGTPYDDSTLYITVIRPSESTWGDGDRTVICVVNTENAATEMTDSAEGSKQ